MAQEIVVKVCYGIGNGCLGVLWHRIWFLRCVTTKDLVFKVCYDIGNGCLGVLWHGMVVQVCYGTETGCSGVLWQRNRVGRCVMEQELVVQV
jgi:hypothetical protein